MKVYLGGPITGLSYKECTYWRNKATQELEHYGFEVHNPMREKEHLENETELAATFDPDYERACVERDLGDVTEVDIVLMNMAGSKRVSIGSVCEIGFAAAMDKPVLLIPDAEGVYDHLFINVLTQKFNTVSDAVDAIVNHKYAPGALVAA